ncbi:unnamed protein product, partial [Tetraodon nigroviridis]
MSRKKTVKGKAASRSPSAGSPTGKRPGRAAKSSPGIVPMNGVVHPSRPPVSSSSEFYDIAFKVMLVGDSGVGKTCLLVRFKDAAFLAGSFISTVGIDFRGGCGGRNGEVLFLGEDGLRSPSVGSSEASSEEHHEYLTAHERGGTSISGSGEEESMFGGEEEEERSAALGPSGEHRFILDLQSQGENKVLTVDGVKVKLQIWDTAGQERFRSVTHAYYRDAHALLLLYDVTNKASFDNIQVSFVLFFSLTVGSSEQRLSVRADAAQERVVKREDGERLAKEFGVPFMETSARSGLNVDLAFTAVAKELKHRSVQDPSETFKLQEYVNKEMKSSGCCR